MEKRFNFTKNALDSLPLPERRTLYYDAKVRGLAIQIMPAGSRVFYLYRKVQGRPQQTKIGAYPDFTIEQARNLATEMNSAIAKQEDPSEVTARKRRRSDEWTFGQLSDWWMEHAEANKKAWEIDKWTLGRNLAPLKSRHLSAITKADLRRLHAELTVKRGSYAANRAIELIRAMFNRAKRYDLFEGENPALGVELNRKRSRDRRLTAGEIPRFFTALEAEDNPDMRDYVYLSLYTGARQMNVLSMRWDELDFIGRTWRIPETKNGLPQVIPLEDPEIEILKRRMEESTSPWVFPSRAGTKTGHLTEPKTAWRRILKRGGLKDLRMHDLRRTLGSWMADTGASLHVIGKALGHQSSSATQIYARLSLDPIREAKLRAIDALHKAASEK